MTMNMPHRKKKLSMATSVLFITVTATSPTYSASFNCKATNNAVEIKICGNAGLSSLDDQMAKIYAQALVVAPDRDILKNEQREWVKKERNKCKNIECLKLSYINRTQKLRGIVESKKDVLDSINNKKNETQLIGVWESYGTAFYNTGTIKITPSALVHEACKSKFKLIKNGALHSFFKSEIKDSCYAFSDTDAVNYISIAIQDTEITVRYYSSTDGRSLLGEGTYSKVQ